MNHSLFSTYKKIRKIHNIQILNEELILIIAEFWFEYFEYVINVYNKEKIDKDNLKSPVIATSILKSFSDNSTNEIKSGILRNLFSNLFILIFQIFPIRAGILPGGVKTKFDLFEFYRLKFLLNRIEVKINQKFLLDFYFELNKDYSTEIVEILKIIIPKYFFSISISNSKKLPKFLIGSPLSFLDFNYIYMKLILQNNKINLTGFQHGGVYGEWKKNNFEKFEKKISNSYFGWGLLHHNIEQNKYKIYKNHSKREKIYWIGRDYQYYVKELTFMNAYLKHHNEKDHIVLYKNLLVNQNIYFVPHPRGAKEIYSDVFNNSSIQKPKDTNKLLSNYAKCVIFDTLGHTLLYSCISNRIPFLILIKSLPIDDLTPKARELYLFLLKKEILITCDSYNFNEICRDKMDIKINNITSYFNEERIFDQINTIFQLAIH